MKKRTIFLYVEDNPDDVTLLRRGFKFDAHAELHVTHDGQEAIDYLSGTGQYTDRSRNPLPNVILLDLKMPRVDGFGVLTWLQKEAPKEIRRIPVVVMSSSAEPRDVNRAYDLGANCYLTKPINWTHFQDRMMLLGLFWSEHAETPTLRS
jgi:CheY-like chemotaxis protein